MNSVEEYGLDVSGREQWSVSVPLEENKELPTFIQSIEHVSNYWHGEIHSAIDLFMYLFI
jgi:hypothetical protein